MSRISRDRVCMDFAIAAARRSTCLRLQVGAAICLDGRPLTIGYNGAPPGVMHCTPENCNDLAPCTNATHAEQNAIAWAARKGISVEGATLYVTDSPCFPCARILLTSGISRVIFSRAYRDEEPLKFLLAAGVKIMIFAQFINDPKAFYGSHGT